MRKEKHGTIMSIKISENLRALRIKERYSLEDVAEIIGVSRQSVAKWESGESLPDIEKCAKLSKLYKVTLDALVNEAVTIENGQGGEDGKYCFGISVVGEDKKIILPDKAMSLFDIRPGDGLLILADKEKGMALVKCGDMNDFIFIDKGE